MSARATPFTLPLLPELDVPARPRLLRGLPPAPPPAPQPQSQRREAWLAVRLPNWPLFALVQPLPYEQRRSLEAQPLAIVDDDRFRSVLCCNDLAFRHGVRPGHRLNAAMALCADLSCRSRDRRAETQLLATLAVDCQRFTPVVVLEAPDELLLEVRGSLKLFGGTRALMQRIDATLKASGIEAVLALSRTARSAQWFVRASRGHRVVPPHLHTQALGGLPLHVLRWPDEVRMRLRRFGITEVGELLRLPRGGLARRIGRQCLLELDQAQGRSPDLRHRHTADEPYHDRILLDFEIETTALAETLLCQRFARLRRFLHRRNAAISELRLSLLHRERAPTNITLGLATPTADVEHLGKLLHERLAALQLPAPIREMLISAPRWFSAHAETAALPFDPHATGTSRETSAARARLLEQLRARLGHDGIRQLRLRADARPHCTQHTVPAEAALAPTSIMLPRLPARPLWLLAPPVPLAAHSVRTPREVERIDSGWWDDHLTDRDYFVRETRGSAHWVYRDRLRDGACYAHGLFA